MHTCGGDGGAREVHIVIEDASEAFELDTPVSYELIVPADGGGGARIAAPSVYGALHALETLSQLVACVGRVLASFLAPAQIGAPSGNPTNPGGARATS